MITVNKRLDPFVDPLPKASAMPKTFQIVIRSNRQRAVAIKITKGVVERINAARNAVVYWVDAENAQGKKPNISAPSMNTANKSFRSIGALNASAKGNKQKNPIE